MAQANGAGGLSRRLAVGKREVDEVERCFEGNSQVLVRFEEEGGVEDDF